MDELTKIFPTVGSGIFAIIAPAAAFVLGVLVKRAEYKKLLAEYDKLKAETITTEGQWLKQMQDARSAYDNMMSDCGAAGNELLHAIRAKPQVPSEINRCREKFCDLVFTKSICALLIVVELEAKDCSQTPERLEELIDSQLVPDFQQHLKWLAVINTPDLLALIERTPMKLKKRNFWRFSKITKYLAKERRTIYENKIDVEIGRLCQ